MFIFLRAGPACLSFCLVFVSVMGAINAVLQEYDILRAAHTVGPTGESTLPGKWVNAPERAIPYTSEHLKCLSIERQGNCHDPDAWKKTKDPTAKTRHNAILTDSVRNSPGILNASDPWVWESNLTLYKVVNYHRQHPEKYIQAFRKLWESTTVYLVGDSLTRQWSRVLLCELIHLLGIPSKVAQTKVHFFQSYVAQENELKRLTTLLRSSKSQDYIVLNFGHHLGESKLHQEWRDKYVDALKRLQSLDYGLIPDQHVFFRTTSVRHFLKGSDWNTTNHKAGGNTPNNHARWGWYGGATPEQPNQNLLALELLAGPERVRDFQILDTAPMMLPRGDATFDGSHMCLPGPHQFWSQMLYYRMNVTLDKQRQVQKSEGEIQKTSAKSEGEMKCCLVLSRVGLFVSVVLLMI
jgi:hypothetical protein